MIEGPNGSGKSSLTAAIIWALTGDRPRDQDDRKCEEGRPVYGSDDKHVGNWPPVASYPRDIADLKDTPDVRVAIVFSDTQGNLATFERYFDGQQTTTTIDPRLNIPSILLEAGLSMPARLPNLRLDQGRGRLTEAVQKLTGLDDLIDLGAFVQGLCHGSREYLSYKTGELKDESLEFDRQIETARVGLVAVNVTVPPFKPSDTENVAGEMAMLGKLLNERAAALTEVIAGDLEPGLNLADAQVQKQINLALAAAEQDLKDGLEGLGAWKTLTAVASALDELTRTRLRASISTAKDDLQIAVSFRELERQDHRYRLKAVAARWHHEHGEGTISSCPLCAESLRDKPGLQLELESLQSAGEAASRRFADNVNSILNNLTKVVPQSVKRYLTDRLTETPKAALLDELRTKFTQERYKKYLVKCQSLMEAAFAHFPAAELATAASRAADLQESTEIAQCIASVEAMCANAEWFQANKAAYETWWKDLTESTDLSEKSESEAVSEHLKRLSKSLGEAEPYRIAAEAMRKAWKAGKAAYKIECEQARRTEIADALSPLKNLGNLAESQARTAINDLSDRIGEIHSQTYISDNLQFHKASLEKKAGLVVRGQFSSNVRIDATLVANSSWLRGVLWAFIFALREEAVEQLGNDVFPILVLDDPQQTFDSQHRHRWAEQIARLQKSDPGIQLFLTTHEELFLEFLKVDDVRGRHALICAATPEHGHIGFFEGDDLSRRWNSVQQLRTPAAAKDFMAAVRVYLEGMLKLMLRGEDVDVSGSVVGGCREKLATLHKAGSEPWCRQLFDSLAKLLGKGVPEIKFMEIAHHASGAHLGLTEAVDVEKYWRKSLRPALERAFRIARDHRALHGGLTALHAMQPTISLPEGYKNVIRGLKLPLVGSAAALSSGRVADGRVHLTMSGGVTETIELKDHSIFRIAASTLEPVARSGDFLLVSDHTAPTAKSLVVALDQDRLLARRLEIADNHSDVAVLTANTVNPRMIAAPIVGKVSTMSLRKIVGVVFENSRPAIVKNSMEILDCGGEASVKAAFVNMLGLVEIAGHSAEPQALDKQFIIVGKAVGAGTFAQLEGRPVIVEDSSGSRYLKRLRAIDASIILESLEISGDFPPVLLALAPGKSPHVVTVWPVLGVLFERPK